MTNIYYSPERHGLEVFGEVDWSGGGYEFDLTVVWRDPESGKFYLASDMGCSCPSPFEGIASVRELEEVTREGAIRALTTRRQREIDDDFHTYGLVPASDLIDRLRTA